MTIFACWLPFDIIAPIFDMFLHEGWRAVFKIGIALLKQLEPVLLQMDMEEMAMYFRDTVRKEKVANQFDLFQKAARVRVNKILVNLEPSFAFDLTADLSFVSDSQQGAGEAEREVLYNLSSGQAGSECGVMAVGA